MNRSWRYHMVAGTFWADKKIRSLSQDARAFAIYLLTCPERTGEGFYSLPYVLALDHLGWMPERLEAARSELREVDFAEYDTDAELVFIVRGLKYHAPRGVKQIRGAINALDTVHGSPDLFSRFLAAAWKYAPEFAGAIVQRYGLPDTHSMGYSSDDSEPRHNSTPNSNSNS